MAFWTAASKEIDSVVLSASYSAVNLVEVMADCSESWWDPLKAVELVVQKET